MMTNTEIVTPPGSGVTPITPPNNTPTKDTKEADESRNNQKSIDLSKIEYTGEFTVSGEPAMTNRAAIYIDDYQPQYISGVWEVTRLTHTFGDKPFETQVGCRSVTQPQQIANLTELIQAHQNTGKYQKIQKISSDSGESGLPNKVNRSLRFTGAGVGLKDIMESVEDYE